MLKTIAIASPELIRCFDTLKLPLNTRQHRHVTQIADGPLPTYRVRCHTISHS
jgi:hypothetical protein